MPRMYRMALRPVGRVKTRQVNPLLLPQTPSQPAPEPQVAEPGPASLQPSTDMTLAELRALADERGVPSYGTKADIVARLIDG
jgi:SAP domain